MPKYRVQGPDGAIHVFEGPENASPADIEAFAAQTFSAQPKQQAPAPAGPDDPGVMQSALIGAGRTVDRIGKGMQQLYYEGKSKLASPTLSSLVTGMTPSQQKLAQLKADAGEDDRLYKPLQAQHPIATAVGESAPSMVVPVGGGASLVGNLGRLALAGAAPGALEYGSAGERAGRAAVGAGAGVVGGVVVPKLLEAGVRAVPAVGRTAKAILEPLYAGGREQIVGRTLNTVAGADAAGVLTKLRGAAPLVPGSAPTAAQVAENGGIAALERSASARNPADFAQRGMEQSAARLQALRGIAGDDAAVAAAKASRATSTKPMYDAAAAQEVEVTPALRSLLERPSVQQAMARAQKLAQEEGRDFGLSSAIPGNSLPQVLDPVTGALVAGPTQAIPAKITGQTLQDLKMGIDALLKDPTSGIVGREARNVEATRGQLLNWMENAIPDLRTARTAYAAASKPINQMQIGQNLLQRIEPALADYGALGRETGNKYALALRNADQTARQATGFKGAGMADTMTPQQMQTLEGVAADLARKSNAQDLGRGVGSNTFQNFAVDNIAAQSGAPRVMGAALSLPGVSKVGKFMYSGPEEKIQSLIGQALLDPAVAARLMGNNALRPNPANLLFANPSRPAQILGGATGLTAAGIAAQ